MEELISIIVPIYKVEKYLKQCIDSIINQTYKNLEIILIDDGSPDGCGKICDKYAKSDVRIKVIHKENGGLSSARNAGLDIATGSYIAFIDSDDYVAENFIEKLYKLCIENNADIAECDFLRFENNSEKSIEERVINKFSPNDMQKRLYSEFTARTVVVWNKLYKRKIYEDLRFPLGKINEDEFITYKAFYNCKTEIIITNERLYFYRYNEQSIMGKKFNIKRLDLLYALEERKVFYKEKEEEELYKKTVFFYQNILKNFYILTKENVEDSNKYLKDIKKRLKTNYKDYKDYKDYKKNESIKYLEIIKMRAFVFSPKLYLLLICIIKKSKEMINTLKEYIKKIIVYLLSTPICKVNNKKIVFDNFSGKGYGCNPKYIAEELIRQNVDCDMVWLVNNLNEDMPSQIRKVKYGTMKAKFELATAKIWIDNVRNYKGVNKKKNQYYIQTWHATLGIKNVEKEVEDLLSPQYVKEAKYDGKITDLMVSNNTFMTNLFKNSFWYDGDVLEIGFPRNDILYNVPEEVIDKVYNYFSINKNQKIVIYAPTFRNNMNIDDCKFDFQKCIKVLNNKFNNEFVMLVRLHPNVSKYDDLFEYNNVIMNATNYPDIQELLAVSSVGITDYSSISFEMSMIGKPVFLICKDFEEFKSSERKFALDFNNLPFMLAKTEEELLKNIEDFSIKEYNEKCECFYKNLNLVSNADCSKKIVDIIKTKIKGG